MGEARRRKALGLSPRTATAPIRVRELTIEPPVELAERLQNLCPPQFQFRDWLVGALAAFADWAETEKLREAEDALIVKPYHRLPPKLPSGSLLGGRV